MRIGINATCLDDRSSGATQRFKGIYAEIFKRRVNDEFVVYEPANADIRNWFPRHDNVSYKKTAMQSTSRWKKFALGTTYWPRQFAAEKFDVFEGFHQPFVAPRKSRRFLTIHDIRGMCSNGKSVHSSLFRVMLEKSVANTDEIITVSESMKREIQSFFPKKSINVMYNGIDTAEFSKPVDANLEDISKSLNIPEDFVLSIGHFEPRKNYLRLIDTVSHLKGGGDEVFLVIVGNDNGYLNVLREHIDKKDVGANVRIFLGLSDIQVRALYKKAKLFVFPSLYEGFGIPVIEAMASNTPIALSNIDVFREITENSGAYFPPEDSRIMAEVIASICSSSEKAAGIVKYGQKRAMDFDFKKVSLVYDPIIARGVSLRAGGA